LVKRIESTASALIQSPELDQMPVKKAQEETAFPFANDQAVPTSVEATLSVPALTSTTAEINVTDLVTAAKYEIKTSIAATASTNSTEASTASTSALDSSAMTGSSTSAVTAQVVSKAAVPNKAPLGPFRPKKIHIFGRTTTGHQPRTKKCGTCTDCLAPNCLRLVGVDFIGL